MKRAKRIARTVARILENKDESRQWLVNDYPARTTKETVDVVGKPTNKKDPLVLIEIELRRGNPVGNVVKVWKWIDDSRSGIRPPLVLIQAFSTYHLTTDGEPNERQNSAKFLGRKLEISVGHVRYFPFPLKYTPRKGAQTGGGRTPSRVYS